MKTKTTAILLLLFSAGCANLPLPKSISSGSVAEQRKKREEEFPKQFDRQRDFAEYEAARNLWIDQRDPKGCREALQKLLARNPKHCPSRLTMAELYLAENDPQSAYKHAKAALEVYPNDAQVQYTMAIVMDAMDNRLDALAYYERAMKMAPQCQAYAAAYQMARAEIESGDSDPRNTAQRCDLSAEAESQNILTSGVENAAGQKNRSGGADPNGKTGNIETAELAVNDPIAATLRSAQEALQRNDKGAAMKFFAEAAGANPYNPQIPVSSAAIALRVNRPDVALEILSPAAAAFPNSASIHRMLGAAYYRAGDYNSAQVSLQQALSLDKSSALSYLLMGCTLTKLGQKQAAEANFQQARAIDQKYNVVR